MSANTNDRELLDLAAKAAGIDERILAPDNDGTCGYWNPLTDDGDALRLAVKLDLLRTSIFMEIHEGDPDKLAATRRAIVRAAAEIGRSMP